MKALLTLGREVEITSVKSPPVKWQHGSTGLCYN